MKCACTSPRDSPSDDAAHTAESLALRFALRRHRGGRSLRRGAWWLLRTPSGLDWIVAELERRTGGALQVEGARGPLTGPLRIARIHYKDERVEVVIEDARLSWSPWALRRSRLDVQSFAARRLQVDLKPSDAPATAPADLSLPLEIDVRAANFDEARINGEALTALSVSYAGGAAGHQLRALGFGSAYGRITAQGRIDAAAPFPLTAEVTVAVIRRRPKRTSQARCCSPCSR